MKKWIIVSSKLIFFGLVIFTLYKVINFIEYNWKHAGYLPHDYQIELGYEFDMISGKLVDPVTRVKRKEGLWVVISYPHELQKGHQLTFKIFEVKTGKTMMGVVWDSDLTTGKQFPREVKKWKPGKYRCIFLLDEKEKATKIFYIE
jgi:hypothetical protein